jgi:hypothetical protein
MGDAERDYQARVAIRHRRTAHRIGADAKGAVVHFRLAPSGLVAMAGAAAAADAVSPDAWPRDEMNQPIC